MFQGEASKKHAVWKNGLFLAIVKISETLTITYDNTVCQMLHSLLTVLKKSKAKLKRVLVLKDL